MGFGDDLITSAIVKRAHTVTKKPVMVGDGAQIHWSEVFENNPRVSRTITDGVWVKSYPGHRPYIKKIHDWGYEYADFKVSPGELFLTDEERDWPEGFIYIEPNIKAEISKNKDWGFENWQAVVQKDPERWIQGNGKGLRGVKVAGTKSFRQACGLLSRCRAFVGTDGGLHHAAAALGVPAVVVWTGFSSPEVLGYETHKNLRAKVKTCGRFADCDHCKQAAKAITPDMVLEALDSLLRSQ